MTPELSSAITELLGKLSSAGDASAALVQAALQEVVTRELITNWCIFGIFGVPAFLGMLTGIALLWYGFAKEKDEPKCFSLIVLLPAAFFFVIAAANLPSLLHCYYAPDTVVLDYVRSLISN